MNKLITVLSVIAIAFIILLPSAPSVEAADIRPELISGEVISLWNYMARGQHGEEAVDFSTRLVEKGLPIETLLRFRSSLRRWTA